MPDRDAGQRAFAATERAEAATSSRGPSGEKERPSKAVPTVAEPRVATWPARHLLKLEAAAVWMRALCPSRRMTSTMDKAVNGFAYAEAAASALVPAGRTMQSPAFTRRKLGYILPFMVLTVLPIKSTAFAPARTTVPAPSVPTGNDLPILDFRESMCSEGIGARKP